MEAISKSWASLQETVSQHTYTTLFIQPTRFCLYLFFLFFYLSNSFHGLSHSSYTLLFCSWSYQLHIIKYQHNQANSIQRRQGEKLWSRPWRLLLFYQIDSVSAKYKPASALSSTHTWDSCHTGSNSGPLSLIITCFRMLCSHLHLRSFSLPICSETLGAEGWGPRNSPSS